ncbi:DUF4227 family protein [Paenibacillus methanolicus]|uniref:DUF4227 family protein n=1 Tax=Paenibacillus methanolicus TaxID=582686 RepID=UPI0011E77925|nr:DUF4227 family protein [Paenibacillus methanolicus]
MKPPWRSSLLADKGVIALFVFSARRWYRRAAFMILLVLATFVMYNGCRVLGQWIVPSDPYRVPQGAALKVFGSSSYAVHEPTFADRLRLFYWYGE